MNDHPRDLVELRAPALPAPIGTSRSGVIAEAAKPVMAIRDRARALFKEAKDIEPDNLPARRDRVGEMVRVLRSDHAALRRMRRARARNFAW
jgi:hypothetical protein